VNAETLSFDEIEQVCTSGEGHYLGSDKTLKVMQSEYIYPDFGDRSSPNVWEESGKPIMLQKAIEKKRSILAGHFPNHVSDSTDYEVRAKFPIFLSREAIGRN